MATNQWNSGVNDRALKELICEIGRRVYNKGFAAANDGNISITYGRPLLKNRVVGESVEPMDGRVWRLGADEATTLVTDKDMMIRGNHVPAGEYTLWAAHMGGEFHLIVNEQTGQWGTNYDASHDLHHVAMDIGELGTPADQLTLSVTTDMLKFEWGTMTASVPIMVHD